MMRDCSADGWWRLLGCVWAVEEGSSSGIELEMCYVVQFEKLNKLI